MILPSTLILQPEKKNNFYMGIEWGYNIQIWAFQRLRSPPATDFLLGMHPLQDDHPGVQLCLYLGTPQLAYLKIQGEMILIYNLIIYIF